MKKLFFFALILFASPLRAQSFHWDTTMLGQARKNQNQQRELPLNGYVGAGAASPSQNFNFETNMRVFRDIERSLDDYDLYQTVLGMKPSETVQVSLGRQFVAEGFAAEIIDGVRMKIHPDQFWLSTTFYSGVFRSVEIGDFNKHDGLWSGMALSLEGIPHLQARVQGGWRKNNITLTDFKQNDDVLAGTNLSYDWSGKAPGLIYGVVEYDTTAKLFNTGTVGIDLNLSKRLSLNVEGNYFNINRDTNRNTILSLFTRGGMYGGRFGTTVTLLPKKLDWIGNVTYQRIEIQQNTLRSGHLIDTAFLFSFPEVRLHLQPGYFFSKSFGGRLHGAKLSAREDFSEKVYADVGAHFVSYRKITADNDIGFSTSAWSGYQFFKGWTLSGGVEYNKNNVFKKDIRGSFKLEFHYDTKKT